MPQNASDPEHVNLMFFLVVYVLCLWLLSFLIRFRTYFKLRNVLLAEQEAVSSGRVDEAMYPGTFKGWDLDVDQDEWLNACREGKYAPTWRGRQAFAASKSSVEEDAKVRLQRRKAIQRRNAQFDPDPNVVFHPGVTNVTKRLVGMARAFPLSISAFRGILGVQNPVRATGAHVNYFHMDVDQLLGKSLGRAVGDAADGVNGQDKGGMPVPLHPLKFTLSRPTISIGGEAAAVGELYSSSVIGTPMAPNPTTPTPSSTRRRLRRRKGASSGGEEDVSTPSDTNSSPPIQSVSSGEINSIAKGGSSGGSTTAAGGGTLSCCPSLEVSDGNAFGLPMKRQVPGYRLDSHTREAMVASGLRPLKIEIDVHRDIQPKDIHVSALLIVSRQDLVVELWNSIARQQGDGAEGGREVSIGTDYSHSNDRSPELTPACSAPDFGPSRNGGAAREEPEGGPGSTGSGLYARRSKGTEGSLSLSREATDTVLGAEEGGCQFSQFVKQVSSASFQKGPPLSLRRDVTAKRARIADDSALEESIEGDAAAVPLTPITSFNQPPTSPGLLSPPPSALQGAYRKVSFIQALHCDQIEQMEMSFDEDSMDILFPIVLVVEHKASLANRGSGRNSNTRRGSTPSAVDDVALVYCGRIVGSNSSSSTAREDAAPSAIVIDFKLEYARIGGVLFGVESPVFNVGAPGPRSRQVPLLGGRPNGSVFSRGMNASSSQLQGFPMSALQGDGRINTAPSSAPNTPWGSPSMGAGTPRGAHTRTGSFHSCVSADSRHFRTSSLNESAISEDDSALCLVCFERDRSIIFLPCGHFAVCDVCLLQLAHCPVCRTPIKEYLSLSTRPTVMSPSSSHVSPGVNTTEGVGGALDRFVQRLRDLPSRIRCETPNHQVGQQNAPTPTPLRNRTPISQPEEIQEIFPAAATLPRPQITAHLSPIVEGDTATSPVQTPMAPTVTSPTHLSNDLSNDERFQSLSTNGSEEELVQFHAEPQPPSPVSSASSTTEGTSRQGQLRVSISGVDPLDATQELIDGSFSQHLGLRGVSPSYSVNTHRGTPTDPIRHVDPTQMGGASEDHNDEKVEGIDRDDDDDEHSPPSE